MLFQRISRRNPERVFGIFQNINATSMVDGDVVVLNVTATPTLPGTEVLKATALSQVTVIGAVAGTIASLDFGTVQIYGYHPGVKTTQAALAAGSVVYSNVANAAEVNAGAIVRADIGTMLGVSVILGAANKAPVFIKCMGG
jgi:hypothetical protein